MKNNAGRFSQGQFGQTPGSSSLTSEEAYKLFDKQSDGKGVIIP